jgi:hypothetical protein
VNKLKAIIKSILDAVWFGSYTVLPTVGFLFAIGFLEIA